MNDLFGTPISDVGFDTVTACLQYGFRFVRPHVARMYGLFYYRPFADFLCQWQELDGAERDEALAAFSEKHHTCLENFARGCRKALEVNMVEAKRIGIVHSSWLDRYYDTRHWEEVKRQAAESFDQPILCQTCGDSFDHWHHRTYKRAGQVNEHWDLIPLCKDCHVAVHAMHDLCKRTDFNCGTMPKLVRDICDKEDRENS